ncbi:MAG: PaaI family thioesterase [Sphingomonadales bacterium]
MSLHEVLLDARNGGDLQAAIDQFPYARFLDLALAREGDRLITTMRFSDMLIGSPAPPTLHGGTVGALLEIAGTLQLMWDLAIDTPPKTVDISIDYLRAGRTHDTHAAASITRQGRRVANVRVEAWQLSRAKPIALAQLHFLLT